MKRSTAAIFVVSLFPFACVPVAFANDNTQAGTSPGDSTGGPCTNVPATGGASSVDEFQAVCSTWQRLGMALKRGDRDAALTEFSLSARERYAPVIDALLKGSSSYEITMLGNVESISTSGRTATLTLVRKRDDRTVAFSVSLVRSYTGKWVIADM